MADDLSRFDRDPDALSWARQKIQRVIDQCAKFERDAAARDEMEISVSWRSKKNFMQMKLVGGEGCVIAAFDERLPEFRLVTDREDGRG